MEVAADIPTVRVTSDNSSASSSLDDEVADRHERHWQRRPDLGQGEGPSLHQHRHYTQHQQQQQQPQQHQQLQQHQLQKRPQFQRHQRRGRRSNSPPPFTNGGRRGAPPFNHSSSNFLSPQLPKMTRSASVVSLVPYICFLLGVAFYSYLSKVRSFSPLQGCYRDVGCAEPVPKCFCQVPTYSSFDTFATSFHN